MTAYMKYTYDYDEIHKVWDVLEVCGGAWYNRMLFSCTTEQDAIDAIEYLIELNEGKNKE